MKVSDRRDFLKSTLMATAGLSVLPVALSAMDTATDTSASKLKSNAISDKSVILFQGDSITDAGRNKKSNESNNPGALGSGYAFLAAANLLNTFASKNLEIYNKGISGNKVYQIAERWQADCLDLKPTVLSILIGVNDFWHKHSGNYKGTAEIYENDYRALLKRTKEQLPQVKLVICEPFAVLGCRAVDATWFPEFDQYRAASKKLAKEFGAIFVPFQEVFDDACKIAPPKHWTPDGVHPSIAGAQLMADAWMKFVFGK